MVVWSGFRKRLPSLVLGFQCALIPTQGVGRAGKRAHQRPKAYRVGLAAIHKINPLTVRIFVQRVHLVTMCWEVQILADRRLLRTRSPSSIRLRHNGPPFCRSLTQKGAARPALAGSHFWLPFFFCALPFGGERQVSEIRRRCPPPS